MTSNEPESIEIPIDHPDYEKLKFLTISEIKEFMKKKYMNIFEKKIKSAHPTINISIVHENNAIIVYYILHESNKKTNDITLQTALDKKDYTFLFWNDTERDYYNSILKGLPISESEYLELQQYNLLLLFQNMRINVINP